MLHFSPSSPDTNSQAALHMPLPDLSIHQVWLYINMSNNAHYPSSIPRLLQLPRHPLRSASRRLRTPMASLLRAHSPPTLSRIVPLQRRPRRHKLPPPKLVPISLLSCASRLPAFEKARVEVPEDDAQRDRVPVPQVVKPRHVFELPTNSSLAYVPRHT